MLKNKRGFLIPIIIILVLAIVFSILGLVFIKKFWSLVDPKLLLWSAVAVIVIVLREPIVLALKLILNVLKSIFGRIF